MDCLGIVEFVAAELTTTEAIRTWSEKTQEMVKTVIFKLHVSFRNPQKTQGTFSKNDFQCSSN